MILYCCTVAPFTIALHYCTVSPSTMYHPLLSPSTLLLVLPYLDSNPDPKKESALRDLLGEISFTRIIVVIVIFVIRQCAACNRYWLWYTGISLLLTSISHTWYNTSAISTHSQKKGQKQGEPKNKTNNRLSPFCAYFRLITDVILIVTHLLPVLHLPFSVLAHLCSACLCSTLKS